MTEKKKPESNETKIEERPSVPLECGVMPRLMAILECDVSALQFAQFTIDWLEEIQHRPFCPNSFRYEVDNILGIMKPDMKDYRFFKTLSNLMEFVGA